MNYRSNTGGVGVLIPCLNEASTIGSVISEFRAHFTDARIVVVDNGSQDGTADVARSAGAEVHTEYRRGKGFAVRRGLVALAAADYVIMVDGDGTYSVEHAAALLDACARGAHMAIGARLSSASSGAFPLAHEFGNKAFIALVRMLFGVRTSDLFSGFRVLSRDLLDEIPLTATGFEIEAELTLRALAHGFHLVELPTPYGERRTGSHSKLRTVRDGFRILREILAFFRDYRPMLCFGLLSMLLLVLGITAGSLPILEYVRTSRVNRLPLAVLAVGLVLLSSVSAVAGLVLSSVARRSREMRAQLSMKQALRHPAAG